MSRSDLQALSPDDLAALANRGLVKRAQKEIDAGQLSAEWDESDDGTLVATWSDGVTCTLPGDKTVRDAECDCAALSICRHILRTVLAWQLKQGDDCDPADAEPWDPGEISDELIEEQVSKSVMAQAKRLWSQGVLAELLRTSKPSARFHLPGHTVRFPVQDDCRYVLCSCTDPAPCVHAVLAIKAFRLLPENDSSGIVSEGTLDAKVDPAPLDAAEASLVDALESGFANLGSAWRDRLRGIATECLGAGYSWPAQILDELIADFDRYTDRDAAFQPLTAVLLLGEFLVRKDAIQSGCAPVPQSFVRGLKSDRDAVFGSARFVGLGSNIQEGPRSTTVHTFLQDTASGHVVTLSRNFNEDPEAGLAPRDFDQLARTSAVRDASIGLLAAGQLVTQGGKRTATGRLIIGRARAAVNPQNFEWQHLKAPLLVEDYDELTKRLALLPPASFRPRQAASDFHVCPVSAINHSFFDPRSNCICAGLSDHRGAEMRLAHPWSERGRGGAESLLTAMNSGKKPMFVAGHIRSAGSSLMIRPTMFVFENKDASRTAVLPWLDPASESSKTPLKPGDQIDRWRYDIASTLLEELLLSGDRRLQARKWPGWQRSLEELEATGCHRMTQLLRNTQNPIYARQSMLSAFKLITLAMDCDSRE